MVQTGFCPNLVYTYAIAGLPTNSTSALWTVPAGATITNGQGTEKITVSYPATGISGNITVQGISNCGMSSIRTITVKIAACPPGPRNYSKGGAVTAPTQAEVLTVKVSPNPTVTDFKLQVQTTGKDKITVRILDMQGRVYKTLTVAASSTISIGNDLRAGSYLLEVRQGSTVKTTKLLKF